jgi:hypothetical protein
MNDLQAYCQAYICLKVWNTYFAFTPIYLLFLTFGIASLLLFSSQMIRQPTYLSVEKNDPIGLFPPQYLTFQAKYRLASLTYAMLLFLFYFSFVIILDQPGVDLAQWMKVKAAQIAPKEFVIDGTPWQVKHLDQTVPLLLAFMLIGLLPRIAAIEIYEKRLREWIHEIFLIPALGRATASRIENAPINPTEQPEPPLELAEIDAAGDLLSSDTYETLSRLAFLTNVPDKLQANLSAAQFFDTAHLATHEARFKGAEAFAKSFSSNVRAASELVNATTGSDAALSLISGRLKADHEVLQSEVRFLSLVIAGAVLRQARSEEQINRGLKSIGLQSTQQDLVSSAADKAIYISTWVAIAYWIWRVLTDATPILVSEQSNSMTLFAEHIIADTIDGVITFFIYVAVIFSAMRYRSKKRKLGEWGDRARSTNCFKLVVVSVIAGAVAIFSYQAVLFGVINVPHGGTNWWNIARLSFSQSLYAAVVALLVALLTDREEGVSKGVISLVLSLLACAFFAFLSGFYLGYVQALIFNAAEASDGRAPAGISAEQWQDAFGTGLLGLWIIFVVVMVQFRQVFQLTSLGASMSLWLPKP